jgi:hypothetical protein
MAASTPKLPRNEDARSTAYSWILKMPKALLLLFLQKILEILIKKPTKKCKNIIFHN